jgi:hypothetical protein
VERGQVGGEQLLVGPEGGAHRLAVAGRRDGLVAVGLVDLDGPLNARPFASNNRGSMAFTSRLVIGLGFAYLALIGALGGCSAVGSSRVTGSGGSTASGGGPGGGFGFGGSGLGGGNSGPVGDPVTCEQAAADKAYVGCDFWPTVVDNLVLTFFDYAVVVANAGDQPADVTVTRNGATVASATVATNDLSVIYLPWVPELSASTPGDACNQETPLAATVRATGGAYHLVSTRPVTVYQFNPIEYKGAGGPPGKDWSACNACPITTNGGQCYSYSNDASLLIPSTAMTGSYRITGQHGWNDFILAGPYFAVTGTADGTTVTVHVAPGGMIVGGGGVADTSGGGTATVTLDAGDVVEVVGDPTSDFSGSLVTASKPVQVITGVACIDLPSGVDTCDHIEESVLPTETLGKDYFVTVPTSPNGNAVGHIVRLYGNVDGTKLTYPGSVPPGAPQTLDAGQFVDLGMVHENFEVRGDHELAVSSFQLGNELVDPMGSPPKGDPSQSQMVAVEQYRTKYVFLAPLDYDVSYVDVVAPQSATVTLDGATVSQAQEAISSGFGVARIKLGAGNNGAHVLTASAPVGVQVIGYGGYTSYQYPGGLNLSHIAPPPTK